MSMDRKSQDSIPHSLHGPELFTYLPFQNIYTLVYKEDVITLTNPHKSTYEADRFGTLWKPRLQTLVVTVRSPRRPQALILEAHPCRCPQHSQHKSLQSCLLLQTILGNHLGEFRGHMICNIHLRERRSWPFNSHARASWTLRPKTSARQLQG